MVCYYRFWHTTFLDGHTHKSHNNQPCWFPIWRSFVIEKATQLSVSKNTAWWLNSLALQIMFLFMHHVGICEIGRGYHKHWKKKLNLLPCNVSSNVWKLHSGQSDILLPITNELLWYVVELHEKGMVMTSCIVSARHLTCAVFFMTN